MLHRAERAMHKHKEIIDGAYQAVWTKSSEHQSAALIWCTLVLGSSLEIFIELCEKLDRN